MGSLQTSIIVLAFFCVIVTLFIVVLLVQRVRYNRTRKALKMSEERSLQTLESSTDGLWDWNIRSDTVFYSDRFLEILGVSSEHFPGTMASLRSRLHPEDADITWKAIERHLQDRIAFLTEYRLKTKSGGYRWFLARGQAIWDGDGNADRMSGWIQDITERKQAELDLQQSLSEIRQLKDKLEAERAYLQD